MNSDPSSKWDDSPSPPFFLTTLQVLRKRERCTALSHTNNLAKEQNQSPSLFVFPR